MKFRSHDRRLREVLVRRAFSDLSSKHASERGSMTRVVRESPDDLEIAAAAIYLAFEGTGGTLPDGLRQRLHASALAFRTTNPPDPNLPS